VKLPRRLWFTFEELAVEWNTDLSYVMHFIESGKLELSYLLKEEGYAPALFKDQEEAENSVTGSLQKYDKLPKYDGCWVVALKEVEQFESGQNNAVSKVSKAVALDNPKAAGSLLKMVAAMAIVGYAYDPNQNKSNVSAEIVADAERIGLEIEVKTVRKWLKISSQLINEDNTQ
jgi:hypothetical protein